MIALILLKKILSLFLIMGAGIVLVKSHVVKSEDSKILSLLSLYLFMPCVIITSFQVEYTPEVRSGLLLALAVAVLIHILLLLCNAVLKRFLHLDAVEQTSVIYSNAGALIVPLVSSILGAEWVIYTSAFLSVQMFLLWSHARAVLCGEKGIQLKRILTNINMISIFIGIFVFITNLRFPVVLQDAMDSLSGMVGPAAMLVTGMLIGNTSFRRLMSYKRIWLITALRLLVVPILVLLLLKYSGLHSLAAEGRQVLLVTFLATMTPSASTITQMSQVYGKDADYAGAINVMTTLLCCVTMPLMVALYQM